MVIKTNTKDYYENVQIGIECTRTNWARWGNRLTNFGFLCAKFCYSLWCYSFSVLCNLWFYVLKILCKQSTTIHIHFVVFMSVRMCVNGLWFHHVNQFESLRIREAFIKTFYTKRDLFRLFQIFIWRCGWRPTWSRNVLMEWFFHKTHSNVFLVDTILFEGILICHFSIADSMSATKWNESNGNSTNLLEIT